MKFKQLVAAGLMLSVAGMAKSAQESEFAVSYTHLTLPTIYSV